MGADMKSIVYLDLNNSVITSDKTIIILKKHNFLFDLQDCMMVFKMGNKEN